MDNLNTILFNLAEDNREFKCDICNKYLSIAPILFNDSVGNVCGRCFENGETKKFDASNVFVIQKVYENIAKYITFPCSYRINGCLEKLKWANVRDHEETCEFQRLCCPLAKPNLKAKHKDCANWAGSKDELVLHMDEQHSNYFSDNLELKIYSEESVSRIQFSKVKQSFVIVDIHYYEDVDKYHCRVLLDVPFLVCKTYKYDLEIFNQNEKRSIVLPDNQVEPLAARALLPHCVENSLELDFQSINKLLKIQEYMVLRFKIRGGYEDKIDLLNMKQIEIDEDYTSSELKCHCGDNLYAPIFVCINGHNACSKCGPRGGLAKYCQKCNNAFMVGHNNTTLGILSRLATYPCKNKSQGCAFSTDYEQLKIHELNCTFGHKKCKVCEWEGTNPDMLEHVRGKHSLSTVYLNQVYTYDGNLNYYFIIFDEKLFILFIDYAVGRNLNISLQCLGMGNKKYGYEFSLCSVSDVALTSCHFCQPLLFEEDKKELKTTAIVYPFEFLRQFLTNYQQFKFKINIYKIKSK